MQFNKVEEIYSLQLSVKKNILFDNQKMHFYYVK